MKFLGKILLYGLPAGLERALVQQLGEAPDLSVSLSAPADRKAAPVAVPDIDLVIYADGAAPEPALSPGTPALPVDLRRPARLGVILRLARQMLEEPTLHLDDFRIGAYVFNPQEKTLTIETRGEIALTDRREIALTDKEADILVYLAKRGGTVGRDDLLKHVWRYQEGVDTHTLETHIYRLRQKMEVSADNPVLLVTDEGGYRLKL
jgi:DNA-binding winged helix-turn-helix (wHTH) protein